MKRPAKTWHYYTTLNNLKKTWETAKHKLTNWPPTPAKTLSLSALSLSHTHGARTHTLKSKDELSLKRTIGLTTITEAAAAMPSTSAGRVTVPDWTMCAPRAGYDWFQTDSLNLHRSRGMSRWTSRKSFRICICESMIRFQSGLWGCGDFVESRSLSTGWDWLQKFVTMTDCSMPPMQDVSVNE